MALDLARSLPPELKLWVGRLGCHLERLRCQLLVFVKLLEYRNTLSLPVGSVRLGEVVFKKAIVRSRIG